MLLFVSSLLLLMCRVSALEISTLNDFIDFTNNVNNGINNYTGETVFLTNDLDMTNYSSSFVPVGNSTANTFRGTFDGQRHMISNLVVSSDEVQFLGIFGYSKGATIKNIVVDKSCSFESNYLVNNYNSAIGGILGWCDSYSRECIVEGCVNMAQITYSGINIGVSSTYLGGIIGKFTPVSYDTSITNCVNYGNISSTSTTSNRARIGGITGEVWTKDSISVTNTIKDCVNFGALYQSGELTDNLYIGGISGIDDPNIVYENCVSLGSISYNESISGNVSSGSVSGFSNGATFKNCFWDNSIGLNVTGTRLGNTTIQEGTTSLDLSQFTNGQDILETLIVSTTTIPFSIINFDSNGGSAVGPVILFLSAVTTGGGIELALPSPVRVESTFRGWYSDEELTAEFDAPGLPAGNTTVYAKWDVNKYAVTFSVDGDVYNESSQEYGTNITYPPTAPTKDGFTFDGWYNDSAFTSKANTDLTVRGNLTLYGRFISTTIRVEFRTKDLSTEGMVKEIERVAGCTDCFTIIKVESDEGNTPAIIVKFNDIGDAVNFVEAIQGDSTQDIIGFVVFVNQGLISFSPIIYPIASTIYFCILVFF